MNFKAISTMSAAGAAISLFAAAPVVSNVSMTQNTKGTATITYTLSEADAVVTLDIQTNATGGAWTSIGGEAVSSALGDVWKAVGTGTHTIKWDGATNWGTRQIPVNGIRAVITAWALNNTPDYMVVDIADGAQPNSQRYYPSVDFLPGSAPGQKGAITNNTAYRLTKLVMRKIMTKDIEWTMGSTALETLRTDARENTHPVTLTNNYYIGVFEITQNQWAQIQPARTAPSYFSKPGECAMRPVDRVCYNEIRNNDGTSAADNTSYNWPHDPNPASFLGLLRTRTGIPFDLPSEAQWEFACRAGNGDTKWGDGSAMLNNNTDSNLAKIARYYQNGGSAVSYNDANGATHGPEVGTAYAGTYRPNSWGLYDMSGNIPEWCLDYYEENIAGHGGMVNINPEDGTQTRSGNSPIQDSTYGPYRVVRGGGFGAWAYANRPAFRNNKGQRLRYDIGLRVVCPVELQ
ncbi:MAG: formylglycine-generating enzyme family protein [Kiritimatiellae bacterium]|nr:formylglycine-generating enzyme family protein [Kiritimatiellia bacterium]